MSQVRVALIGYGVAGAYFHGPLIASAAEMTMAAIVSGNPDRVAAARKQFPDAKIFSTADAIFSAPDKFDLVVVASPNRFHATQAEAALKCGIPVVIDKPFAVSIRECEKLVELSRQSGIMLTVFHNRRWDSDFLTVKQLIDQGTLSPVYRIESRFERYRPVVNTASWRESSREDGGGLLLDLISHLADQACVLFGMPAGVYAELHERRDGAQAEDDAFVALQFAGGVRAHLWANVISAVKGPRFRVLALNGSYEKYGMDPQEDALRAGKRPSSATAWGVDSVPGKLALNTDQGVVLHDQATVPGAYQEFYRLVAQALLTGGPPPVLPEEALRTMRVLEMARESTRTGCVISNALVNSNS